ncbi:hypothetical protein [Zobellella sp. DQSA1]|uniref:hypothetical protein n=1 Tax=Zobellella sp. DQSA1 TaxID=3342386 RepID=UPI0035C00546
MNNTISAVLDALAGEAIDAQASSQADIGAVDMVPLVRTLGDQVTAGHTYPLRLPPDLEVDQHGVYQLAGRRNIEADGWTIARTDTWLVSLRAASFDALRPMADGFVDAVAAHTGPVGAEITDAATDYEFDQRQFRAHFELQTTALAGAVAPAAAFVHELGASAQGNALATMAVRQTVTEQMAVVLVANALELEGLRLAAQFALLGLELDGAVSPLEYGGGSQLGVFGHQVFWRETYQYQRVIRSH